MFRYLSPACIQIERVRVVTNMTCIVTYLDTAVLVKSRTESG